VNLINFLYYHFFLYFMNPFEDKPTPPPSSERAPKNEQGESKVAEQFTEIMHRESFVDGYVSQQTTVEQKVIADLNKQIEIVVKRKMSEIIDAEACAALGVTSVQEGQKMGKEWGKALGGVRKKLQKEGVTITVGELETKLDFKEWQEKVKDEVGEEFMEEMNAAKAILEAAQNQYRETLTNIRAAFLERLNDPDFIKVLEQWGESPSLDKTIMHAGLVHFIEYRADKSKDRLSKVPESFSPEGLAEYTARVMEFVNNPTSEDIAEAKYLRDESGRERLLIMTKDNQYISAFKTEVGGAWQIITHIPEMKAKEWNKTKDRMADAKAQAKYHNKLEGEIEEIAL